MKGNKFLHISDLHFSRYEGSKSVKQEIDQYDIKKKILSYINDLINEKSIDAIIISGDLEFDSIDNISLYIHEWLHNGAKVFIVFGEHDKLEMRKQLKNIENRKDGLYILEEPEYIKDNNLEFTIMGMSCESKQIGFKEKFNSIHGIQPTYPSIFLTHPCNLPKTKMIELGFNYYAVGHIHYKHIEKISEKIYIGRPGHIYSIWDGNGKAWPTKAIIGEFIDNDIKFEEVDFPVPQTRRLYVNPFIKNNNKQLICIENCPKDKINEILEIVEGDLHIDCFWSNFKGYYSPTSQSLEKIVYHILNVFIDDIFVTPSDPKLMKRKYGFNRMSYTAKTILNNNSIFKEFIERIFKASKNTQ